ncbi:MAG TPA: signal peptide peptidase SppA, partial [Flavobacterium sp.]
MRFLGNVLAVILGLFIFCMIFFFGILLIGAIAGGSGDRVTVKTNSVIELDLTGIQNDYGGKTVYKDIDYSEVNHDGLSNILSAIEKAKTDDKIKGISIINNFSQLGVAQSKALRDQLEDFKKSGKFVLSYGNVYTQKDYYINSVADTIYINPVGNMDFKGLSSEVMFFKDLQEKSGIKIEVVRHGKYKSAVEPFLENKMSEANRKQITELMQSIWSSVLIDISKSRSIPVARLNLIADGLLARTPEMAKNEGLVDKVVYEDEYHKAIRKALKVDKDKKYNKIDIRRYAENVATTATSLALNDEIALIYAQGDVLSGEGSEQYIGEGSMRRSLQQARRNDDVKAVVLRIDSPGGSALTSDLIWREVELTKKVKPVIVSMGNLAASGGYYIACNATQIFAESSTITGSIGVFGMLPNLTELSSKMGINTEQVNTNTNAAGYSPFVPLDEKFRNFAQFEVERIYSTFISRVAAGRKMTLADVDSIGQGRIWSGSQALKLGLVDKIGGMDDAIKAAAKMAKISEYNTRDYPEYEKNFRDFLGSLGIPFLGNAQSMIKEEIGEENYWLIEKLRKLNA